MGEIRKACERSSEAFYCQAEQKCLSPMSQCTIPAVPNRKKSQCYLWRPFVIIACNVSSNTLWQTRFLDALCLFQQVDVLYPGRSTILHVRKTETCVGNKRRDKQANRCRLVQRTSSQNPSLRLQVIVEESSSGIYISSSNSAHKHHQNWANRNMYRKLTKEIRAWRVWEVLDEGVGVV